MTKILVFSGSVRKASFNLKLAKLAENLLRGKGADVTAISLLDYDMPIYNGDAEEAGGQPENAKKLARLFSAQHGIFIACPEYNASLTPLLKNTIDWISRVKEEGLAPFSKPFFVIGSASPGWLGGYRALTQLRLCLEQGLSAHVLPETVSVNLAHNAFAPDGSLKEERFQKALAACIDVLFAKASQAAG